MTHRILGDDEMLITLQLAVSIRIYLLENGKHQRLTQAKEMHSPLAVVVKIFRSLAAIKGRPSRRMSTK